MEDRTETHRHRQQKGGYQREGVVKGKGVKHMAMEDGLTVGGGHTMHVEMCT